jgi:hypothetical protein
VTIRIDVMSVDLATRTFGKILRNKCHNLETIGQNLTVSEHRTLRSHRQLSPNLKDSTTADVLIDFFLNRPAMSRLEY